MSWSGKVPKTTCNQGDWVRVCVFRGYQNKTHNQKKHTTCQKTPTVLVLIRPILNKIQPIKSSKEFERNVWITSHLSTTLYYLFTVTCITFRSFEWLYFVQKVASLTENVSILWRSMCTFWHCTYYVNQAKILNSNAWKSTNPKF